MDGSWRRLEERAFFLLTQHPAGEGVGVGDPGATGKIVQKQTAATARNGERSLSIERQSFS